jgi:hypothetical protein
LKKKQNQRDAATVVSSPYGSPTISHEILAEKTTEKTTPKKKHNIVRALPSSQKYSSNWKKKYSSEQFDIHLYDIEEALTKPTMLCKVLIPDHVQKSGTKIAEKCLDATSKMMGNDKMEACTINYPKLTKKGYYIQPNLEEMMAMDEKKIARFEISHRSCQSWRDRIL